MGREVSRLVGASADDEVALLVDAQNLALQLLDVLGADQCDAALEVHQRVLAVLLGDVLEDQQQRSRLGRGLREVDALEVEARIWLHQQLFRELQDLSFDPCALEGVGQERDGLLQWVGHGDAV